MAEELSLKELNEKVNSLSKIVEKQSALISKTGQQLIEFQVKNVKDRMNNLEPTGPNVDLSDYVTNEDIVQLVGELQSQLDSLEDRCINRLFNSKVSDNTAKIEILSNKDGEIPDSFPATLHEFKELDRSDVLRLCDFYELIVPDNNNLDSLLNDDTMETLQQVQDNLNNDLSSKLVNLSEEEVKELKLELARFLGLVNYK